MAISDDMDRVPAKPARARRRAWPGLTWLGVVPFFIFALMFLLLPTVTLVLGAFQDAQGHLTLQNLQRLNEPAIRDAYWISFKISAVSAAGGSLIGFLLALAALCGGMPAWIRPTLMTFSGVASNFAGVPLSFAFLATLGRMGLVTMLMQHLCGLDLYASGFSILSFSGLALTYLYFQIPLMILIVTPAIDGLKPEWREACESLGGGQRDYWTGVALPVLLPAILGAALLLFANAFGAVATAYALTGSALNIVPILLFAQIRGDVLHDQNLGYALALGMIVVTGLANAGYIGLRRRTEKRSV